MRGGTMFSGIGAPEMAAPFVDWRWAAEIDPFASAVHAARFPGVTNLGDVTEIGRDAVEPVDLIVFGSPCQSFSVAGKRLGLDDPRGNLALVGLRVVERVRPEWVVFENVPGLLSSDGGRDFGAFLGLLGQCGYGFAYRVLDAQHFGVPQRRRRVFVVGHLGDWRPAAAVLFERESLSGHPAPSRETGQRLARPVASSAPGGSGYRNDADTAENLIARSLNAHPSRIDGESETFITHSLRAEGFDASEDGTGRATPLVPVAYRTSPNCGAWETGERTDALTQGTDRTSHLVAFSCKDHGADHGEIAPTLRAMGFTESHANAGGQVAVAFTQNQCGDVLTGDVMHAINTNSNASGRNSAKIQSAMSVRRLTPVECERLQGFPDHFTAVTYRGKPAADGPRYRALGNSMAVPVIGWLIERVSAVQNWLQRAVA